MTIPFSVALQRYLQSVGINKMYGVIGREASDLTFNTLPDFEFILTRHEMTAGVMATSISRFTKSPQVCFGTLGPGLTNYMTALATATLDRYPLILIVAQIERPYIIYNDMHQCIDNASIANSLSKFSYELKKPSELKSTLETALKVSMTLPFGPSVISIPIDILASHIKVDSAKSLKLNRNVVLPSIIEDIKSLSLIKDVAKIIRKSKNPLILIGDAVTKTEGASDAIKKFSKATNVPIIYTYSAKGIMDEREELNFGVSTSYLDSVTEQDVNSMILDTVDTFIFFGYDLNERHPFLWSSDSMKKTFININSYRNQSDKALKPAINIVGDLNKIIDLLNSQLKGYKNKPTTSLKKVHEKIDSLLNDKTEYNNGIMHLKSKTL